MPKADPRQRQSAPPPPPPPPTDLNERYAAQVARLEAAGWSAVSFSYTGSMVVLAATKGERHTSAVPDYEGAADELVGRFLELTHD